MKVENEGVMINIYEDGVTILNETYPENMPLPRQNDFISYSNIDCVVECVKHVIRNGMGYINITGKYLK